MILKIHNFRCMFGFAGKWLVAVSILGLPCLSSGQQAETEDLARRAAAVAGSAVPPAIATASLVGIAGEYSFGNGFDNNVSLVIHPDGTFDYRRFDCDSVLEESTGTLSLRDSRLYLNLNDRRRQWPRGMGSVLVLVPWGQRLYLVPENDFIGFCNVVNRGMEPVSQGSIGDYYLREGDWDRDASGQPEIPRQYQPYLLKSPPHGTVKKRDTNGEWLVDFGKESGAYSGLEVTAWSPDRHRFTTLRLTDIGDKASRAQDLMINSGWDLTGWTVVTRVAPETSR